MISRILHALTSAETWTNIGCFGAGLILAELRAWVAGRLTVRRWQREAEMQNPHYQAVLRALERSEAARQGLNALPDPPNDDLGGHHGQH